MQSIGEVPAQPRPLRGPSADADVDVVALGEDPAVPARDGTELEHEPARISLARDLPVRDAPLQRDGPVTVHREPQRARDDPVRAVGRDQHRSLEHPALDLDRGAARARDSQAVAELGAGGDRPLDEVGVEPAALRHQRERLGRFALEPAPVADPQLEARHDVLDHRVDRERKLAQRPDRDPAAARLVARKPRPVEQEHRGAGGGESVRGR